MPAPTTKEDLLGLVRKSNLLTNERLEAFLAQAADSLPGEPGALVDRLVQAGLVTHFQAEQFMLGKWRGFTLGKYRVLERLGFGGTGTVYLCEHQLMRHKVAVKVLPISKADNPAALGRFYREARAAGALDHPNLVKAHDIDQDNGLHFLVMDYVDGTSLQEIIARFGPLAIERAAHYTSQAALGLQAAHLGGLIHRDIKPANILLDRQGTIRVLDLGLARFFCDEDDPLTLKYDEKNVLGTADYVAPEQALNSHEVDIRADIYSLGATLYFLLVGHPPFEGGKAAQKLIWHQVRVPTPVRQLRPEIPEGLSAVVARMLAKNPGERYQTPVEVVEALAPWTATPIPPPSAGEMPQLSPAARGPVSEPTTGPQTPTPRPGPWTQAVPPTTPVPVPGPRQLSAATAVAVEERTPPAQKPLVPEARPRPVAPEPAPQAAPAEPRPRIGGRERTQASAEASPQPPPVSDPRARLASLEARLRLAGVEARRPSDTTESRPHTVRETRPPAPEAPREPVVPEARPRMEARPQSDAPDARPRTAGLIHPSLRPAPPPTAPTPVSPSEPPALVSQPEPPTPVSPSAPPAPVSQPAPAPPAPRTRAPASAPIRAQSGSTRFFLIVMVLLIGALIGLGARLAFQRLRQPSPPPPTVDAPPIDGGTAAPG